LTNPHLFNQQLPAAEIEKLKDYLTNTLLKDLDALAPQNDRRSQSISQRLEEIYNRTQLRLDENAKDQVFREVIEMVTGYGPIQPLLDDPGIDEVMVNGHGQVYIERKGKLVKTDVTFDSDEHVRRIIDRIILPLGRRVNQKSPTVDARLPDGSRVNAVIPPVAIDGPSITIRKFAKERLTVKDLIQLDSISEGMIEFLRACVIARLNIIISGGTGSGKTTLLNVLSALIPDGERIVTIEDAAELQLRQEHIVRLETKPPDPDGQGLVTTRDLVRNSLRMRPDRIIVGEVRGGEALDMLQAMNTGHDGSLTTAHSNSPRDTLARLEVMCLMAGMDLPMRAIREQIASAVDFICHQERLRDGTRRVIKITEIQGMEGDVITMSDIFEFEQTGIEGGKIIGRIRPTGLRPKFIDRIEAAGIHLPPSTFGIGRSNY
jgi:pilus assembly protein CpaF